MIRLIFPINSFAAYVEFEPKNKALTVVLRKGSTYLFKKVNNGEFKALESANNKGSYLCNFIMKEREGEYLGVTPMAIIEQITLPKTKFYLNIAR